MISSSLHNLLSTRIGYCLDLMGAKGRVLYESAGPLLPLSFGRDPIAATARLLVLPAAILSAIIISIRSSAVLLGGYF